MTAPRLALRMSQRLHVGAEIRRALQLLQLPGIELEAEVRREIVENPCLELEEECEGPVPESVDPGKGERLFEGWRNAGESWEDWPEKEIPAPPEDLGSCLRRQISLRSGLSPRVRRAAEYWIGCLDERGYTAVEPGDVARDLELDPDEAIEAWELVRSLDPPGVGATDLRDALGLQIERLYPEESTARRLVHEGWSVLSRGVPSVAQALDLSTDEVTEGLRVLARLSPRPGHEFDPEPVQAIWPDVLVREVGGRFLVTLEEAHQPRVRWSPAMNGVTSSEPEVLRFLGEKRRAARWLLRALQRRRKTLLLVSEAIVASQEPFFRRGPEALRPLTLRDIGGKVGLHESTVARVTQDKYADTPRGLLPMRFFFCGRVQTRGSEDMASNAVKERIREMVRNEESGKPISDKTIAQLLGYEGIRIARRTVAKYRIQMGIPRAQLRGLAIPAA